MLTWSDDRTARLWSTDQEQPLRTFKHDGFVGALFNRDESRVLTWSFDGTARLWSVNTFPDTSAAFVAGRMRDLETRTRAEINDQGAFRQFSFTEWQQKLTASTQAGDSGRGSGLFAEEEKRKR